MAKFFTSRDLQPLLAPHPAPCLSLFLPTPCHPPQVKRDPPRFTNLLRTAEDLLRPQHTPKDISALLEPLHALPNNGLWQTQAGGLAVFRSAGLTAHYWIPQPLPELAVVADRFHVKPLIEFLYSNHRFFVLILGQKRVALYVGTPQALEPVDLTSLPSSLIGARGVESKEPFPSRHASALGGTISIVQGLEVPPIEKKEDLARFFSAIDKALKEMLRDDDVPLVLAGDAPLVLAGVCYYHRMYHTISCYQHLARQGTEGNCAHASPEEIHAKLWPIVNKFFRDREDEILHEYAKLAGSGRTTNTLQTVARAAVRGQIRQLLVAEDTHLWGMLDRATGKVTQHPSPQDSRDHDVLDDLIECVLARGGKILVVPAARMPGRAPAAAILRW
jgi:hypothetical protein